MKKTFSYILITAFVLMPLWAHAAASPSIVAPSTAQVQSPVVDVIDLNSPLLQGKSLAVKKKTVQIALQNILSKLTDLSSKTQSAINQLNVNGIDTTIAQTALIATNITLDKAKIDSAKTSTAANLDILKVSTMTAENSLVEAKKHLIDSLGSLKTLLPTLDTVSQ